jgi:hypothetical protein
MLLSIKMGKLTKSQKTYLYVGGALGVVGGFLSLAGLFRAQTDRSGARGILILGFLFQMSGFITAMVGLNHTDGEKPQNMFNVTTAIYFSLGAVLAIIGIYMVGKVSAEGLAARVRELTVGGVGTIIMFAALIGMVISALKPNMNKALIDLNWVMTALGLAIVVFAQIRQRTNKGYRVDKGSLEICLTDTLLTSTLDYTIVGMLLVTLASITTSLTTYGVK